MAVVAAQVAVSTTRAKLTTASNGASGILVQAPAGATLFVGGDSVTSATGFPIPGGQTLSLDFGTTDELYGILAAGSGTASVLRTGV